MKFLISILLIITVPAAKPLYGQASSNVTFDAGASIEITVNADLCADAVIINGTFSGGGTICSGALPVELTYFNYSANKNNVTLTWETAIELNNSGFEIERALITNQGSEPWQKIGFIQGSGTTNEPRQYMFDDKKLGTGKYKYRLKQIDYNSGYEYYELSSDVVISPPNQFQLGQNYPNPSNPKSKINFEIPVDGRVTVKVYDILGKVVMTLIDETRKADYYTIEFDGSAVASGVYFYRISAEGEGQKFTKTLKMVLVK